MQSNIYIYIFSFFKYNKWWWHWPGQQMESCYDLLQWCRMDKKKTLKWVQKYLRELRLESLCVLISTASTILIKCFHPSCQRKRSSTPFALDMQLRGDVARLYNHDFKEVCGNVALILIKKFFFLKAIWKKSLITHKETTIKQQRLLNNKSGKQKIAEQYTQRTKRK